MHPIWYRVCSAGKVGNGPIRRTPHEAWSAWNRKAVRTGFGSGQTRTVQDVFSARLYRASTRRAILEADVSVREQAVGQGMFDCLYQQWRHFCLKKPTYHAMLADGVGMAKYLTLAEPDPQGAMRVIQEIWNLKDGGAFFKKAVYAFKDGDTAFDYQWEPADMFAGRPNLLDADAADGLAANQ